MAFFSLQSLWDGFCLFHFQMRKQVRVTFATSWQAPLGQDFPSIQTVCQQQHCSRRKPSSESVLMPLTNTGCYKSRDRHRIFQMPGHLITAIHLHRTLWELWPLTFAKIFSSNVPCFFSSLIRKSFSFCSRQMIFSPSICLHPSIKSMPYCLHKSQWVVSASSHSFHNVIQLVSY